MKHPTIRHVGHCRSCGGQQLARCFHFPQMPFTDDFISAERFGDEFRADIDVFVCRECWTAQTQHDVEVGEYYEDYQYSVGDSATASRFMQLLAENLRGRFFEESQDVKVLEVGSGDGQQLLAFQQIGCRVLGYEPSSELCRIAQAKGVQTLQGLFTEDSVQHLPSDFQEVDVVMLSYTFDHLPDPRSFLRTVRSILHPERGLLVVEIHDLEKILERQEYCLFEHEHSIYLTQATAQQMCRSEGLEIIDFDLVPLADRRANSLIFVAAPSGSESSRHAVEPRTPPEFRSLAFYEQSAARIGEGIEHLEAFTEQCAREGRKLAGYGAGGRGVMTLAAMRNAGSLSYLVDKKPKRQGLVVPKSGLPLVGLEALISDPVDDLLVFSFGYLREIQAEVGALGYRPEQLHSLLEILAGRF